MRTRTGLAMALIAAGAIAGCEKPGDAAETSAATGQRRVVLYTNCDADLLGDMVAAFEKQTGIDVLEVADSGASRSAGLSARLVAEKDQPRADVWWSSEPFSTVRLARQGVFEPYTSAAGEASIVGGWPAGFRASDETWYAFARRARVIAYDTRKLQPGDVPRALRDLAEPKWKGRVGMARPLSGTTAGHLAALVWLWGEEPTRQWLMAMEEQGLRLYDGNAGVVRAIADGEIEIGLTDSGDVLRARAKGLPVGLVYEANESAGVATRGGVEPMASFGAMVIPGTAAVVRGAPNPAEARALLDFLISEAGERLIMAGDSRGVPIRESAARELFVLYPETRIEPAAHLDPEEVAGSLEAARRLVEDVFGG